jgi:hypothetical protein
MQLNKIAELDFAKKNKLRVEKKKNVVEHRTYANPPSKAHT